MTAPESVARKVPHYPYPAVEKSSDSVLSAERCIQSQGLTTECGSKGLTAMSGQTMVQMRAAMLQVTTPLGSLPSSSHSLAKQQPSLLGARRKWGRKVLDPRLPRKAGRKLKELQVSPIFWVTTGVQP